MLCKSCKIQKECKLRSFIGKGLLYCSKYQEIEDKDYCLGCKTINKCVIYKAGIDVVRCRWRTFDPAETSKYSVNKISHAQINWLKFLLDDCKSVDAFLKVIK